MESWVQGWQPRTNAFCDFSSPPVESIAPATKKWCQVIRSAAPVTQNHLSKPEDLLLQNATRLRKSAPSPPNSSDEDVSCTATATENASLQILFKCPAPAIVFWKWHKTLTFCSLWTRCTIPCACHARRDLNVQKWSVHGVFCDFDFDMCFAPQRRALFRHLNFQKWSGAGVLCTFWLGNVLRATTACTFSTSQLPKVARSWCVLYILTWKCASRRNGVQFFIWKQRCERPRFGQSPFATFLHESTHPEKTNMAALVTSTLHLPQAHPKNKIPYTKLDSITENRKNQKKLKKNKKKIPEKGWGAHSCWIFVFFFFVFFVFCVFLVVLRIVPPVYRGGFTLKMFSPLLPVSPSILSHTLSLGLLCVWKATSQRDAAYFWKEYCV